MIETTVLETIGFSIEERINFVVAVAAVHAASVDSESRFPLETINAAKSRGLLGAAIDVSDGGLGWGIVELTRVVREVARKCSSSAMILAMHYSQILCLTRHAANAHLRSMIRHCAQEQLLLASATTEKNIGGDIRSSTCAIQDLNAGGMELRKDCPVISYGAHADAILVTARRSPDAPASNQVLVFVPKADVELERLTPWNALGMRGTCSEGFSLVATTSRDYVIDVGFETISAQTMLPASHILWASAWLGMATEASDRARNFVQKAARRAPGITPPSALRLAELEIHLQSMTDTIEASVRRYVEAWDNPRILESMNFTIAMNTIKVSAANAVHRIVSDAMVIVGIAGFVTTSPVSLERLYRDSMAPSVMVNNDRILQHTAMLELVSRATH